MFQETLLHTSNRAEKFPSNIALTYFLKILQQNFANSETSAKLL